MKTIINTWRDDVDSYMKEDKVRQLKAMKPQGAHKLKKSVYSTYSFHVSGCKWLMKQFLKFPLVYDPTQAPSSSSERPAWNQLLSQLEEHKNSDEYRKAVEDSQRKGDDHVRLSHAIWWARHDHEKGKNISFQILHERLKWESLRSGDQELAEDYESGRSAKRLQELFEEKEKKGANRFHFMRMKT